MSPKNISCLFLSIFVFVLVTTANAQVATDAFVHAAARFSLGIQGPPTKREEKILASGTCELHGEAIEWKLETGDYSEVQQYTLSCASYKPTPTEKKKITDELKKAFLDTFAKSGLSAQESIFSEQNLSGSEVRGIGHMRAITRFFFHGSRLYILTFARRTATFDEVIALVKSFRILSKAEYSAALIAENTPASLPQMPDAKRVSPDVREPLRGKVKSVVTESQEGPKGKRERYMETQYDQAGNLVKTINYLEGYPTDIEVWGWIDGKRVMNVGTIEYGPSEGPNESGMKMIIANMAPDSGAPEPKRDERYVHSFAYRFNDRGELVEIKIHNNDGRLWQTIAMTHRPGQREAAIYDQNAKLNGRSVETLDKDGNRLEESDYNHKGIHMGTNVYTHEFDQAGNWITRHEYKKVRGKVAAIPARTMYRTITYY